MSNLATDSNLARFSNLHSLSRRELEALSWLVRGVHPKAIGERMGCGPATVRTYLRRICAKVRCSGSRELLVKMLGFASSSPSMLPSGDPSIPQDGDCASSRNLG